MPQIGASKGSEAEKGPQLMLRSVCSGADPQIKEMYGELLQIVRDQGGNMEGLMQEKEGNDDNRPKVPTAPRPQAFFLAATRHHTPSRAVTHAATHAATHRHTPAHTATCRHTPSHTVAYATGLLPGGDRRARLRPLGEPDD